MRSAEGQAEGPAEGPAMNEQRTLAELRNEASLTQEQLAERAGVSWITVAKLEGGDHVPNLDTLRKLASVLGEQVYGLDYGWRREPKRRGRPRKQEHSQEHNDEGH